MLKKIPMIVVGVILMVLLFAFEAAAAATSPPAAGSITVTNNLTGTPDTIDVSGVPLNGIVKVYSAATGGTPIGVTVSAGGTATVGVNQLGTTAGSVFVTVTTSGNTESTRTEKTYGFELKTANPSGITAKNNAAGIPDVIDVTAVPGLAVTDIIRVYLSQTSTVPVAAIINPSNGLVYVNQLGAAAGTAYVTVQNNNAIESSRVAVPYTSETSAGISGTITVDNNFYKESSGSQVPGTEDTVTVTGVADGDTVKVYKTAKDTVPAAEATASSAGNLTVTINQLGVGAGKIYVTITNDKKAESGRKEVSYPAEPATSVPTNLSVNVINDYDTNNDTVTVSNLPAGIKVNLYNTATGPVEGSQTEAGGTGIVTFDLQSTVLNAKGGTLYLSFNEDPGNIHDSIKKAYTYSAQTASPKLAESSIKVNNNYGTADDQVIITGLTAGTVNIYADAAGGTLLKSQAVSGDPETILISADKLSKTGGKIYVALKTGTAGESPKTMKVYGAEATSVAPSVSKITVVNNLGGTADTVKVDGLANGDEVKVYATSNAKTDIGSAPESGGSATVTLNAPGLSAASGKVYVTIKSAGVGESPRTAKDYAAEQAATAPALSTITVYNYFSINGSISDEVEVSGLASGDIVNVYSAQTGGTPIGTATAGAVPTVKFTLTSALLPNGGRVYVSISKSGMNESPRTPVTYASEKTATPSAKSIRIVNNYSGTPDTVTIVGAKKDDVVNIYTAASGTGTLISPVTATVDGDLSIPVDQLGSQGGRIYVTITEKNKAESSRVAITVPSEKMTAELPAANIKVDNNYNQDDSVTVSGVTSGQIVSVYKTSTEATPVASGTVASNSSTLTLSIPADQLQQAGGKVYVTVKNSGELESKRTAVSYLSDVSLTPKVSNILVINNRGSGMDTVTIIGLMPNDVVTIYDAVKDGNILAAESVQEQGTTIILTTKLTDTAGVIYITVTSDGKDESKRVAVSYRAALP